MENVDNVKNEELKEKVSNEKTERNDAQQEKSEKRDHPKHISIMLDEFGGKGEGVSIALCGVKPTEAIGYLTIALEEMKREVLDKAIRPSDRGNSFSGGIIGKIFGDLLRDEDIASNIREARERAEREFKNKSEN